MKRAVIALCAGMFLAFLPGILRAEGESGAGGDSAVKGGEAAANSSEEGMTHYAQPFVGHSESKKVHRQECRWAEKIAPSRRVYFKTYEEAAAKGYKPCKVCKPDVAEAKPSKGSGEDAPSLSAPPGGAAPEAAGKPSAAKEEAPFIGHSGSKKVHRSDCRWASKIAERNRVPFKTWKEAQAAGYTACKTCKPDEESPSPAQPKAEQP